MNTPKGGEIFILADSRLQELLEAFDLRERLQELSTGQQSCRYCIFHCSFLALLFSNPSAGFMGSYQNSLDYLNSPKLEIIFGRLRDTGQVFGTASHTQAVRLKRLIIFGNQLKDRILSLCDYRLSMLQVKSRE